MDRSTRNLISALKRQIESLERSNQERLDQQRQEHQEQIKVLNDQIAELNHEKHVLKAQLKELKRRQVYGCYDKDKILRYAGQTTNLAVRRRQHFGCVFDESKTTPFYNFLREHLTDGVYFVPIFENLTDLEADEKENALIIKLKELDPLCANKGFGRVTDRFVKLSAEQKKQEVEDTYKTALLKRCELTDDQLITFDNADAFMADWTNIFIKDSGAICKRENCDTKGVGSNGYCWVCYRVHAKATNAGLELQPKRDYKNDNSLERALLYSMSKSGLRAKASSTQVHKIIGGKKPERNTFEHWLKKIDDSKSFVLSTFLHGNSSGKYSGLSEQTINALFVFEHIQKRDATKASERLSGLFNCNEDAGKFELKIVTDKFKNIDAIKKDLKRDAVAEEHKEPSPKKRKVN